MDLNQVPIPAVLLEAFTWVLQFFMVFGGILPYLPQYRTVKRTRDAHGFSTFVCFVLLVSNVLRVLFWYGKRYEVPLLLQSLVMIAVMLAMLHICTQVLQDNPHVVRRLSDFDVKYFWNWTYFSDYCLFVVLLSTVGGLVTLLLSQFSVYVEGLGFVSLILESCLGMPQFWRNYTNKSTQGMSVVMVLLWFGGDAIKTVYFVVRDAPVQFTVCGSVQSIVDIAVLVQVLIY